MADEQPIIIKKKSGHGGHHGGAWKVAYADFVTAMMALFIVLWLMNSSKPIQQAVGGYFRDPNGLAEKKGSAVDGAGQAAPVVKQLDMEKLKLDLAKAMEKLADFEKLKKQIEMTVTPEGLKIEMMENPDGTFFENGKAQPTPDLQELLKVLSVEVGKLPNPVSIEGHTDAKPFSDSQNYGNWELSTDRANAARRLMQNNGLRPDQVIQVRGYADQNLRDPFHPEDASNRRVTLIVQYLKTEQPATFTSNGSLPPAKALNAPPEPPLANVPTAPPAPSASVPAATTKEGKPEK
jgi:chemotaxis protein MotB